jgi:dihydroorotate dehydrogenase (NAD+) catalytic subunit
MTPKLSINIGKLKLKNPVLVASGTFGYAQEFKDFINLKGLGAIVTKTITLKPRKGNPPPRTCETPSGLLNSIGLENPGLEVFLKEKLPFLKKLGVPVIMSIASEAGSEEFIILARILDKIREVAALELNISCPNIQSHKSPCLPAGRQVRRHKLISQDPKATHDVVKAVRKVTAKVIITKLSPNVTDIAEIALAAEGAGSDAVSLVNTLSGMCIDVATRRPKIATVSAGLSGPAIRPVAVRMVWETYRRIKIPIIGMGGIMNAQDAVEFFVAGALAVSLGTANFVNPRVAVEVISGIKDYLVEYKIKDIKSLVGSLRE